ncbi:hypothetical protein GCM10023143_12340 [Compostibacter hankyongensis]|uniref:DUF3823 domain-containing protein n=2 Tax=Compostibacter hankyongensis TaxID=1007089 RepID=A0ABP8FL76_9BACT
MAIAAVSALASCSKIDNYPAPDGGIYGKLTDKITHEGLQTEQPGGFTIKLFEKGGSLNSPISFSGKPDGTYENAHIFKNDYKVLPTEGAFFTIDTVDAQVGSHTELNFEVDPFLAVTDVTVTPASGKVTTAYKIVRDRASDKIVERKTLVSKAPTVNNVVFDLKAETELSGIPDETILAGQHTDTVSGLISGDTYYVRIAVRTDNALKKYNYSKIFKIAIP